MRLSLAVPLLALSIAGGAESPAQEPDAAKPRLELTGCVKRSILTETILGDGDTDPRLARRWRLRGSKEVMRRIKELQGRELQVTGTTRKAEWMNGSGRRIGNTPIYIGGAPGTSSRDPLPEAPTIDVERVEPTGEACRER